MKIDPTTIDRPLRHRRSKRRLRWCKGAEGVEHTPGVRLDRYWASRQGYPLVVAHSGYYGPNRGGFSPPRPACGWVSRWKRGRQVGTEWRCHHQRYCTVCNKILGSLPAGNCPARAAAAGHGKAVYFGSEA